MLNFFLTKNHPIEEAIKKYSKFDFIKRRFQFELKKILDYYHNRERTVDGTNIFYRIIHNLSTDIYTDSGSFFKYVDRNSEYLAKTFKLVSNSNKGSVYENIFYKSNSYAVINYVESYYDLSYIEKEWENISPLRITYSNVTDLDFYLFDKSKYSYNNTIMVCEIDVTMMLMCYFFWCKRRLREDNSTNPGAYIQRYLYPNAMKTHIDIILFNRFLYQYYNYEMPKYVIDHPFRLIDFSYYVDDIMKMIIRDLFKGSYRVEQMLKMVPAINNDNMLETLYINRPIYNRQSEWAIWIARLRYITFIIDILGERGVNKNRDLLYRLPSRIKELENRSTHFEMMLPNEMLTFYKYEIEKLKQKVGRR